MFLSQRGDNDYSTQFIVSFCSKCGFPKERITSFSVVLLSSIAWIVVVFHWLGYLGGDGRSPAVCEINENLPARPHSWI